MPVFFFAGISAEATSWGGFFAGGKKGRPFTVFRSAWHPDRAWGMPPWVHFSATQILRMLRQMCFKPTSHMRCQIVRRECCKAPLSTPGTAGDELPRVLQRERGDGGAAEKGASPGRGPAACRRCRRQRRHAAKILQSLADFQFSPSIAGAHPNFGFWHAQPRPAGHASRPDRLRREKVVFALLTSKKLRHSTTASTTTAAAFTKTSGASPPWLFTAIRLCRSSGRASVRAKTSFLSTS